MPEKVCCWLSIFRRTIAGATELVTEKVSISKLLDKVGMGKNAVTYLLKNALAEGSEEMASDAVNWLADVMISQDKSEWEETLLYYRALGFSEDEAFLAAMKEQGRKMLKDGAAGAITGTITAGGRLAGSKIGDGIQSYRNYREAVQNGKQYYALNQLTQGGLARSLGNMNVEQSYRSMSPETILKNSGLSPTEARFLLENNGYSVEGVSEQGRRRQPFNNLEKGGEINTNSNGLVDKNQEIPYSDLEDRSQWEHYKEILGINAPQDFTDFCNLKYSDEWDSFEAYAHSIENGWLTALAGFDLYKNISSEIDHVLVGETLPNGIKITGKSDHYIDRTIGSVEDRRTGVSVQDALQTIKKPAKTDPVVSRPNGRSQRFIGEKATVTINPDTGNLIQVNPTKSYSKKKRRS